MSVHLIPDPSATAAVLDPAADAAWLALSVAMTDEVPVIADREDLLVTIAPGAGRGAPACFLPPLATIEVDGVHLDVDPATALPHRTGDRARYGTAWGLLVHECAHARHSAWEPPAGAPPGAVAAALLLEESRIEAAQIRRRPDDRRWLRASAVRLVLDDTTTGPAATATPATATAATGPAIAATGAATIGTGSAAPAAIDDAATRAPGMSAAEAARAAALVLGRVDAGILTDPETAPLREVVDTILGATAAAGLREIWQAAHLLADDDAPAMIELGARWCRTLDHDPDTTTNPTTPPGRPGVASTGLGGGPAAPGTGSDPTPGTGSGEPSSEPGGEPGEAPTGGEPAGAPGQGGSALAEAISRTCERIAAAVAAEPPPVDPAAQTAAVETAEADARAGAEKAASGVFTRGVVRVRGGARSGRTAIAGTRPATDTERAAARVLARALSTAGVRDRVLTRTASVMPPGRLRMRGALAADAQRAAGAIPTAEPFTRLTRRPVPTPPLRLGVACDVSGSMYAFAGPVASAAWILAHAAHHTQVPTTTASVIFGADVRAVTRPGAVPVEVTEFAATDNYEAVDVAVDALDGALGLSRPGAARLLVIVSDGKFRPAPRTAAQTRVDRLLAAGCAVLWLAPAGAAAQPLRGVAVHPLTDPTATAAAIGRAATTALRTH